MKEFVFGTAAQFDWLEALLADGRCHVFEHCVLPPRRPEAGWHPPDL